MSKIKGQPKFGVSFQEDELQKKATDYAQAACDLLPDKVDLDQVREMIRDAFIAGSED